MSQVSSIEAQISLMKQNNTVVNDLQINFEEDFSNKNTEESEEINESLKT